MRFFDTNALFIDKENLRKEKFVISSITLEELEEIKNSTNKDNEIKYQAREILRMLDSKYLTYDIVVFKEEFLKPILKAGIPINNDMRIIACAMAYQRSHKSSLEFITNDLSCKTLAKLFLSKAISLREPQDNYKGFKSAYLDNNSLNEFYSNSQRNKYANMINEYLLIYKKDSKELLDKVVWTGKEYRSLKFKPFSSKMFGDIKPKDEFQLCAMDSLYHNQFTMLRGPAGTGKSILALSYLFSLLEKEKIDRIVIFCNTLPAKNAAELGFYPGDRTEKLMDSQIGNFLISHLGGRDIVNKFIHEEKIILLPLADIRGYDTSGMRAGVYVTEAQNLDISLAKLILQRIGEDSICIFDGDDKAQVDKNAFSGKNNGMRRISAVFRGEEFYGEVELQNVYRSKIAKIAEKL